MLLQPVLEFAQFVIRQHAVIDIGFDGNDAQAIDA